MISFADWRATQPTEPTPELAWNEALEQLQPEVALLRLIARSAVQFNPDQVDSMLALQELARQYEQFTHPDINLPDLAKMYVALRACVKVMQTLPTLNGLYGLGVLENARSVLEEYNI